MTIDASYSEDLRAALACVNNQPARTARCPERWIVHRPDGSFAIYLINWGVRSAAGVQPSTTRLPELNDPDVMTALALPQPATNGSRFLDEIDAVLGLEDFERFVFVMSVLEHHSEHDRALLLGCSPREIREGRSRARKELANSPQMESSENQLLVQEKR